MVGVLKIVCSLFVGIPYLVLRATRHKDSLILITGTGR